MYVEDQLLPPAARAALSPAQQRAQLWKDPAAQATLAALEAAVRKLPETVSGQRKGYTLWSRSFAFAAARPVRAGVRLGLALEAGALSLLEAPRHEGWPERLKSTLVLTSVTAVNASARRLLRAAWEKS